MMRGTVFLFLILSWLVAFAQCYKNTEFETLREFLKARRLKKSVDRITDHASLAEYSDTYVGKQHGMKQVDKIVILPGQPSVKFDQYSGYVTVNRKAGRALFYYFTEAEDSANRPLVLWLNGGPGCSSIGNGAMTELGPFRVNPDGKTLWHNKYAWNNAANVLFLESPAGVGFSYSNTSSDYITGDKQTAADSYTFLVNWLERFPEYKTRDLYLKGESYAGHYVPQLADLILKKNQVSKQIVIKLKGIAIGNAYSEYTDQINSSKIGNAYTDYTDQIKGMYDHFWTSALISDEIHRGIVQNCNFSSPSSESDTCNSYLDQADEASGDIYIYNIYAPLCSSSSPFNSSGFDPCSGSYVSNYLNIPQVQKAIHANVTGTKGPWLSCNDFVHNNWQDEPDTVLPLIKELMATGIRVWIYSGDTDGIVPVTTTRYSMLKLGSTVKTPWYPWYTRDEVGGYVVEYENVTFVTVRGAGHFVPSYQPERALTFFSSFLEGKLPPAQIN